MHNGLNNLNHVVKGLFGACLVTLLVMVPLRVMRADDATPTSTPVPGQGVQKTTDEIMKEQKAKDQQNQAQGTVTPREAPNPGRRGNGTPLPQNPDSPQTSSSGGESSNTALLQQFSMILIVGILTVLSLMFQHR